MKKNIFFTFFLVGLLNIFSPANASELIENKDYQTSIKTKESTQNFYNFNQYQYLIGGGDVLEIKLYGNEEYNGKYLVLNDGKVSLPLVGNIYVENMTIEETIDILRKEYSKELLVPDVHVNIFSSRPLNIAVIGELQKPGIFNVSKESGSPSRIVDFLRLSGGITPKSNLEEIELIRTFKEGGEIVRKLTVLNLIPLIEEGDQSNNLELFHGDVIKVKETNNLTTSQYKYAKATLSPTEIGITVVGEVKAPGIKKTYSGISLIEAVMIAGGPVDWQANKQNIQLIREDNNGEIIIQKYRYNISDKISKINNPTLKDGDIINVNTTSYTKISRGLNNVFTPLRDIITAVTFYRLVND